MPVPAETGIHLGISTGNQKKKYGICNGKISSDGWTDGKRSLRGG